MSLQAMVWALGLKPVDLGDVPPAAHVTLLLLADHTDDRGRGAWPSRGTIAARRGLTVKTIGRHLEALEEAGLISRGDQTAARNIPANRRPVVWDLAVFRGDTNVPSEHLWGDTNDTSGGTPGVLQTIIKPINLSTHLTQEQKSNEFASSDMVDYPDRDCIHGHPVKYFHDKRAGRRRPMCPECRRTRDLVTIAPKPSEPSND